MSESLARSLPARSTFGVGGVVVLALAAGLVTWWLVARADAERVPVAAAEVTVDGPRIATVDGLSALAGLRGGPVYWAGKRPGFVFEVTENAENQVFVRYLPSGARLGDPEPDYLTVATYPRRDAFGDVRAAAARPGAVSITVPGGLAVYDQTAPTSVYLAYEGAPVQVEVYSPSAEEARRLVEGGRITPVP